LATNAVSPDAVCRERPRNRLEDPVGFPRPRKNILPAAVPLLE
jgi:hypothetical protein